MKRYVKELISDFRKDYDKKCKENPTLLPAGFLREVNKVGRMCERGNIRSRDAVGQILRYWNEFDQWLWENRDTNAIKL